MHASFEYYKSLSSKLHKIDRVALWIAYRTCWPMMLWQEVAGQTKPNSALRMTTSVELNIHYSLTDCEPFCSGLPEITTLKLFICMDLYSNIFRNASIYFILLEMT